MGEFVLAQQPGASRIYLSMWSLCYGMLGGQKKVFDVLSLFGKWWGAFIYTLLMSFLQNNHLLSREINL